jgi:hypothetical protein
MPSKRPAQDEEAWKNAKKICRLNAQQVEMARALGMNPKKLPGLRPSPQQRWKLRVGEFIEDRYRKRFGDLPDPHAPVPDSDSRRRVVPQRNTHAPERVTDAASRAADLICYLVNLADDLQKWLAHGSIPPEVLPQVCEELRQIAEALDVGAPISPIPEIALPPRPSRRTFSRRDDQKRAVDDEILSQLRI